MHKKKEKGKEETFSAAEIILSLQRKEGKRKVFLEGKKKSLQIWPSSLRSSQLRRGRQKGPLRLGKRSGENEAPNEWRRKEGGG